MEAVRIEISLLYAKQSVVMVQCCLQWWSCPVFFLHALHSIREQTFKKNTILSVSRKTGLLPFDSEIVLEQLREPEAPTHLITPSPSPSSPHTPLTIRSLKRQANSLEKIRRTYHLLFSGSLEDLFVAVLRKTARCAGSRKSSTHASRSESACYEATRWQTYLEGPRSWWSALCT